MSSPFTFKPIQNQGPDSQSSFSFKPIQQKYQDGKKDESMSFYGAEEIPGQAIQGAGIGSLGSYGDILDLFGFRAKETLPGEKAQYEMEARATPEQLPFLVDSDDIAPRYSTLPTSREVSEFGKELGLVKEPKTAAGRYSRRIGERIGQAGVTGGGLKSAIAAGSTGQTLEEAGAPAWMQAAGELIASIKTAPKSQRAITSKSPEVQNTINRLKQAGFSEQDITLAKNALEERNIIKPWAKMTSKAEKVIESAYKKSDELFNEQISKGLPGFKEGGMSYLKDKADSLYKTMEDVAAAVPIKDKTPLKDSISKSIDYLEKKALGADQKKTVDYLRDALSKVDKAETADFYTDLYRGLNKEGKWLTPGQKEHVLKETKDAIMKTFEKSGPEASKFGKYFEKTNESWKKWIDVQDTMELLGKGQNLEGINWKKIKNIVSDKDNYNLISRGLGKEQAKNISAISEGVDAFKNLEKTLLKSQSANVLRGFKLLEGVKSLMNGNFKALTGIIGSEMAQKWATSFLTDPKYQNILQKITQALSQKNVQRAAILANNLESADKSNP